MSGRALLGLALFNGFLLAAGAGMLWGIRGWRDWPELVRLEARPFVWSPRVVWQMAYMSIVCVAAISSGCSEPWRPGR